MPPSELATTLEHRSGLLGICGSGDMRVILQAEQDGDADAALAIGVYLHRLRAAHRRDGRGDGRASTPWSSPAGSASTRPPSASGLPMGSASSASPSTAAANRAEGADREIGASGAAVRTLVVEAREDVEIARGVRRVLAGGRASPVAVRAG